jgi:hypothetical protein
MEKKSHDLHLLLHHHDTDGDGEKQLQQKSLAGKKKKNKDLCCCGVLETFCSVRSECTVFMRKLLLIMTKRKEAA